MESQVLQQQNSTAQKEQDDRIDELKLNIDEIKNELQNRIKDENNKIASKLREIEASLGKFIKPDSSKDTTRRLNLIEPKIETLQQSIIDTANAFAQLSSSNVSNLDHLKPILNATAQHVNNLFDKIFKTISRSNLTGLKPGKVEKVSWIQAPELPKLPSFRTIEDAAPYLCEMIPKLQSYLNAIHDHFLDTHQSRNIESALDDIHNIISALNGDLSELRRDSLKHASKQELFDAIKKVSGVDLRGNTAVGRVRCIACGREIPQVAGAMKENDARRQLGPPPNSVLTRGGALYSSSKDLDVTDLIESPRSLRPFKSQTPRARRSKPVVLDF